MGKFYLQKNVQKKGSFNQKLKLEESGRQPHYVSVSTL